MPKRTDELECKKLEGEEVGTLTVINYLGYYNKENTVRKEHWYNCLCECGNVLTLSKRSLEKGVNLCNCNNIKHGLSRTRLYKIYHAMIDRCYNTNHVRYSDYGGRGIQVCNEWLNEDNSIGLINFYNWSIENGYADCLTIDRKDNNKGYSPDNCRWVNDKEQSNNKRINIYQEINGETLTLKQISEKYNINYQTIVARYNNNISGNDLIKDTFQNIASQQSGIKGVTWDKSSSTWQVKVRIDGKQKSLGKFKDLELAKQCLENYKNCRKEQE
jgi:hypothetical protein